MKTIAWIIAALIGIYVAMCFLGPKEIKTNQSTSIDAPVSMVYSNVADLESWKEWLPWVLNDSSMELSFGEKTVGQDASYSWTSENSGNGSLKIVEAVPNEKLTTDVNFEGQSGGNGYWTFEKEGPRKSKVTWGMDGKEPVPFLQRGILMAIGMNKKLDADFQSGLTNLKGVVETKMSNLPTKYNGYEMKEIEIPSQFYIGQRDVVNFADLQKFLGESFGGAMKYVKSSKMEMNGAPTGLYYEWDVKNNKTDMSGAIPVSAAPTSELSEGLVIAELAASKAIQVDYFGDYSESVKAHTAIEKYINDRGYSIIMPVTEEYITDPTTEKNPSKWLTKITYRYKID